MNDFIDKIATKGVHLMPDNLKLCELYRVNERVKELKKLGHALLVDVSYEDKKTGRGTVVITHYRTCRACEKEQQENGGKIQTPTR